MTPRVDVSLNPNTINQFTHFNIETNKMVIGKQCRSRSDTAECMRRLVGGRVVRRCRVMSPGRPTDIGLQLGKACYPCSR